MRRSAAEKMEIIRLVDGTDLPVQVTLNQLDVPRSTFYAWYQRYLEHGFDGLEDKKPARRAGWNRIPGKVLLRFARQMQALRADIARELGTTLIQDERLPIAVNADSPASWVLPALHSRPCEISSTNGATNL